MKRKLSRIWFTLFLIASITVLIVCFIHGSVAIVCPLVLTFCFLSAFLVELVDASFQASVNPGLKNVTESSFWFSRIYNAWLYVNDREGWALYASFISYIIGAIFGSLFGWIITRLWNISSSVSTASWFSGMFFMLAIALLIATSDHWSKANEYGERSYEEVQSFLRVRLKLF
jgi:hypothetical protein